MSNFFNFLVAMWLPLLIAGIIGLILGWLFFRGRKVEGDLSVESEGALRSEADALRARVQELEGRVSTRDTEISDLKGKLTAGAAGAAAAGAAASAIAATGARDGDSSDSAEDGSDDTYALEWRNRYLAARVKYLEGQISETSSAAPKKTAAKKTTAKKAPAKKSTAKKAAGAATLTSASPKKKKATAKAASKPKVLYTDGPTDGSPDDLKKIKGIGPKFESDLNAKGIYYYRQIAAWKKKDVTMVEGVIDSIPGRIDRDEWVKQAGGLSKASKATSSKRKKPGPKPGTKRGALTAAGKPRKKPGPKKGSKRDGSKKMSEADAAFEKYYTNVKKYDPKARKPVVQGIVKYCGIALSSRDGRLVACSDESELQTVADGFVTKKLGKSEGQMDLVKDICDQMKGERFKQRVTFYYLAAKKARKLGQFT